MVEDRLEEIELRLLEGWGKDCREQRLLKLIKELDLVMRGIRECFELKGLLYSLIVSSSDTASDSKWFKSSDVNSCCSQSTSGVSAYNMVLVLESTSNCFSFNISVIGI